MINIIHILERKRKTDKNWRLCYPDEDCPYSKQQASKDKENIERMYGDEYEYRIVKFKRS